jgi:hypothetical protein
MALEKTTLFKPSSGRLLGESEGMNLPHVEYKNCGECMW